MILLIGKAAPPPTSQKQEARTLRNRFRNFLQRAIEVEKAPQCPVEHPNSNEINGALLTKPSYNFM